MALPLQLSDWTLEHIRKVADDFEPGWFDFKAVLRGQDQKHTERIRQAACAMANTDGGFLVFGVVDRGNRKAGDDAVPGFPISAKSDLRKEFGDILGGIRRDIRFDCSPKAIPVDAAGEHGVFVVHIPKSLIGPHEYLGVFWKRGDKGACQPMDYYDVREQMTHTEERLRKIALLRLELSDMVLTSKAMYSGLQGNSNLAFDRFEPGALKALVADTCAILPAEGGLQGILVTIARLARRVNETLQNLSDHWLANHQGRPTFSGVDAGAENMRSELYKASSADRDEIVRLCKECEEVLKKHFGDLTKV